MSHIKKSTASRLFACHTLLRYDVQYFVNQTHSIVLRQARSSSTIAVVKKRTTQSFSDVYGEYKHKIYSYVLFRVGSDQAVAEDIVSDIFVKAYTKFDTYDSTYAISTWLYTIARNTLIDHYRSNKVTFDIDDFDTPDTKDPLYRLIDEDISEREVHEAIAALPEQQRTYITKQFFDGMTAKEIALEAGVSHDAVRKQVSRGVAVLRDKLLMFGLAVVGGIEYFV